MDVDLILSDPDLARVAGELRALVRPAIRLVVDAEGPGDPTASRLGGRPALPTGTAWPTGRLRVPPPSAAFRRARPDLPILPPDGTIAPTFIAQLRLADLAPHDEAGVLPRSGLLSFFYNPVVYYSDGGEARPIRDHASGLSYGPYDYDSPANWRVLYHDYHEGEATGYTLAGPPAGVPAPPAYPARALSFAVVPTLPAVETAFIGEPGDAAGAVTLTADEWDVYAELHQEARGDGPRYRALGYGDNPQPYSLERGYRAVRARFFPALPPLDGPGATRREEREALLLLQIADLGMPAFGRDGLLLFGIRAADLAARDFGKVWAVAP